MRTMKESPLWDKALFICNTLQEKGFTAYIAGGAVRDSLLGVSPKDFDIATDANTDDIERLFDDTYAVGKAFGTIVVNIDRSSFEVTRFRKDGEYKDGRRPETVEFSVPEEDAKRRDFTINALFFDSKTDQLIDFVGGQKDLNDGVLRFVGDAFSRIKEDKLRIMRGIRFVGQLGFLIDEQGFSAIKEYSYALPQVSTERITTEFKKILSSKYSIAALSDFEAAGLLQVVYPELYMIWEKSVTGGFETEFRDPWTMAKLMLQKAKVYNNQIFSIASFFAPFSYWVTETGSFQNWHSFLISKKYSKIESARIENFMRHLNSMVEPLDLATIKRMYSESGGELSRLSTHSHMGLFPIHKESQLLAQTYEEAHPPGLIELPRAYITGKDMLALGAVKGKLLGEILDEAFDLQLNGRITNRNEALEWVENKIEELREKEEIEYNKEDL
ncbi:MAG: CCA tRNA nucleotidyltransferase [Bdellovibrionales bacterium]